MSSSMERVTSLNVGWSFFSVFFPLNFYSSLLRVLVLPALLLPNLSSSSSLKERKEEEDGDLVFERK